MTVWVPPHEGHGLNVEFLIVLPEPTGNGTVICCPVFGQRGVPPDGVISQPPVRGGLGHPPYLAPEGWLP